MTELDGVIVVDKPAGMTSHDVVGAVRRAVRQAGVTANRKHGPRVGHAGTLDPDATGVLVVCIGRATRLVPFVQASRKTYDARMRLGVTTSTLDASGDVLLERDPSAVTEASLCEALKSFVGDIEQIPPMVSAVKVGGERLYAKARRGEEVERAPRPVTIHDIVLEDFVPGPQAAATFLVTCSSGTYIRTLAADVGERLGVGGHLAGLRRLASGAFSLEAAVDLQKVADVAAEGRLAEIVIPPAQAVADYPVVVADEATATALGHGKTLPVTGFDGPVAVVDEENQLIAMVEDRESGARPLVVLSPAQGAGE